MILYIFMHMNRASLMSQKVKEFAWQCRRHKRYAFDPWVRKIPWEGNHYPLQYSCLENPKDRGIGMLHSPCGIKESYMTEWLSTNSTHAHFIYMYIYIFIPYVCKFIIYFLLGIKEPACFNFWKTSWMPLQMLQNCQNCFANHSFLIL